jgi:hypothetical protein
MTKATSEKAIKEMSIAYEKLVVMRYRAASGGANQHGKRIAMFLLNCFLKCFGGLSSNNLREIPPRLLGHRPRRAFPQ